VAYATRWCLWISQPKFSFIFNLAWCCELWQMNSNWIRRRSLNHIERHFTLLFQWLEILSFFLVYWVINNWLFPNIPFVLMLFFFFAWLFLQPWGEWEPCSYSIWEEPGYMETALASAWTQWFGKLIVVESHDME
jgi:hypothetical protein